MKIKKAIIAVLIFILVFSAMGCTSIKTKINNNVKPGQGQNKYDVIVVGGEPEGIATAISAARNKGKVLLLEKRDGLGGLMTYGMLNTIDMNYNPEGQLLTKGIFQEFLKGVGDYSFDVKQAKEVFTDMVEQEKNIELVLNAKSWKPILSEDGKSVTGVEVVIDGKAKKFYGSRIIDATQDAEIAYLAGVGFNIGWEDIAQPERRMASTLVLHIGGVDWDKLKEFSASGVDKVNIYKATVAGFADTMKRYFPNNPRTRVRGLNIGRQNDGTVLINALQIFGVDGLSERSKKEAIQIGIEEAPYILEFLAKEIPAFKEATLLGVAPELYVRETRHMIGEYTLEITDLIRNRDFEDKIAVGSYPIDIQATGPLDWGYVVYNPIMYGIPFRSLLPKEVDNILVVGRSASYSALAFGSARVMPIGMVAGESAGAAAMYTIRENIDFRTLSGDNNHMAALINQLRGQGVYLPQFDIDQEMYHHWAFQYLESLAKVLRINMGYNRKFNFDEEVYRNIFANDINALLYSFDKSKYYPTTLSLTAEPPGERIGYVNMLRIVSEVLEMEVNSFQQLMNRGIISENLNSKIQATPRPTRAIAMGVAVEVSNWIRENR